MTDGDDISCGGLYHGRFFDDGADGQDGHLRLCDDRSTHDVAKRTHIGNSIRSSSNIVSSQLVDAGTVG